MMTKRYDFIALLSHGWDLYYALAAIESQHGNVYCYSHAKFLERLVEDNMTLPAWVDDPSFYAERAKELEATQKLYERTAYNPRRKAPRVLLMGDDLAEVRRRKELIYGRKRRMHRLVDQLKAQGAVNEAAELERFVTGMIENPVGKVVDL